MDASNPVPSTVLNPAMVPSTVPNSTVVPSTIPNPSMVPSIVPNPSLVQSLFGQTGVDASALLQLSQTLQLPAAQQYHHALLMQQVQAKAMSAAEVALKRAAEISKNILSTNTSDKKSPQESKSSSVSKSRSPSPAQSNSKSKSRSRSPSRSKSKSKSRSQSRSPIRYRRRRSVSPIRYRHDYYRPRNHYYGYRGNNYSRYYRGSYNEYSSYRHRRDWYRDRSDYPYHRRSRSRERRRSRTKSTSPRKDKSRGRKRSETISTSPMKRSRTPVPALRRSHKASVSADAKRDMSRSRDTSRESISPSPSPKARSRSLSQEKAQRDRTSPQSDDFDEERMGVHELGNNKGHGRMQGLNSPTRSPSGSLSVSCDSRDPSRASRKISAKKRSSSKHSLPKQMYAKELGSRHEYNEQHTERHSVGRSRVRKPKIGSQAIGDDESGSDEVMEDWRDDLKMVARRKEASVQKETKFENSEGQVKMVEDLSDHIASNNELKHESMSHSASSEGQSGSTLAMAEQDSVSDKGCEAVVEHGKDLGKEHVLDIEAGGECNESERDAEEDVIYEGPIPASLACEEGPPRIEGGTHTHAPVLGSQLLEPQNAPELSHFAPGKNISDDAAVANNVAFSKPQHNPEDILRSRNHEAESLKHAKYRDRQKKHRRKHRHEMVAEEYPESDGVDLRKHEKHRDRGNKKHRKRHRHENVDEDGTDSDGARKRRKRKHNREGEHRLKDRKRKKHKHRTRSSSESTEDISSTGEDEVHISRKKKKGSRKHKSSKRDMESRSSSDPLG